MFNRNKRERERERINKMISLLLSSNMKSIQSDHRNIQIPVVVENLVLNKEKSTMEDQYMKLRSMEKIMDEHYVIKNFLYIARKLITGFPTF